MRQSNYDKTPSIPVPSAHTNECWTGWEQLGQQLLETKAGPQRVIVVECYPGVLDAEIRSRLVTILKPALVIDSKIAFYEQDRIETLVEPYLGGSDPVFGKIAPLNPEDFLDPEKVANLQQQIRSCPGLVLVVGPAASLLAPPEQLLVFADMPRWEGQLRQRRGEVSNLGVTNRGQKAALQYKRSYFIDWRVCDRLKQQSMVRWDFLLDTTDALVPKLITGAAHLAALHEAINRPFRVVPFFDPGPWGGQWMKEVCGLDPAQPNYAWCFDCVPEENSLLLAFNNQQVEIPSINLVFQQSKALLGEKVYDRFGAEFPIRFDLLDTMQGGNLSFQVHPTAEFIQEHFGMSYTQDESYYLLDAVGDSVVYLGRKKGADFDEMISALKIAEHGEEPFPDDQFVARWPAKKHDHFLIPAGTLHCSGAGTMVLEISATPYIFTFKLWDWKRLGLDGLPRPINVDRGKQVIDWSRDEDYAQTQLINTVTEIARGEGWREEKTGLHPTQFIETRRHWFTGPVLHHTGGEKSGGVNVLNLVQGDEIIVESPENRFEPFVVHYAETFIVPAAVGAYRIRPTHQTTIEYATLKAFVRI